MGTPIIVTVLENLYQHGFEDVVITLDEYDLNAEDGLKARITRALEARSAVPVPTFVRQDRSTHIGMAGGVLAASENLGERFVVANPYYLDMGARIYQLTENAEDTAIGVVETDRPWEYGIVALDDNRVTEIVEKPARGEEPNNYKIMVLHLLDRKFLSALREAFTENTDEEYLYESVLNDYMQQHPVGYVEQAPYQTLKYVWHLFSFFEQRMEDASTSVAADANVAETAVIDDSRGPVIVEAGARIGEFAKISGPCFIGRNALVGDYSFIRGSNIAANATIGAYTEVVRSLIFANSSIHQSYLADSILDEKVKVGAGLTTANKRLDREPIQVMVKEKLRDSGRTAFGIAAGREVNLGISTNTMPGVLIGSGASVYPGITIHRNIPKQAIQKQSTLPTHCTEE